MSTSLVASPESLAALDQAIAKGLMLLMPPPSLTVSEWADTHAVLPRESSAMPGQWVTATAEYQRGLMDAANDATIERIVAMWGAQTGKTASLLNMLWFYTHHDPSPVLMVQPTLETAEAFSKERIAPAIRDTPVLTPLFGDPRSRDSGNTLLTKEFPGGGLALAGANSPAGLASRARRVVLGDEVDKWSASAGAEGDPGKLMEARTATFWNRKIVYTSTPSIKGASRIEREYEKSDQRRYYVACPHCGEEQTLTWGNLKWPSPKTNPELKYAEPENCYYVCAVSGCEIVETDKPEMIRRGVWRATARSRDGKTAGFHLNALYSPWVSWSELIQKWIDAQDSPTELQTFVNASLAETWEVQGDRVEQGIFTDRTHPYTAEAPAGVLVVTAGVDVQKDRLEASAIGWGAGEESWALDHRVFQGDPSRGEVWGELDEWLKGDYRSEDGVRFRIRCALIDSGGHHTKQVYAFTKPREGRRIYACKGRGGAYPPLARPTKQGTVQALLYMVGVDALKENFYARLKIEQEGPGHCHFPDVASDEDESVKGQFDEEFFAQLGAEKLVTVTRGGREQRVWEKRRERNEALDLRVYASAALERLRAKFPQLGRSLTKLRHKMEADAEAVETPAEIAAEHEDQAQAVADYEAEQVLARAETLKQQREIEKRLNRSRPRRRGWVNAW